MNKKIFAVIIALCLVVAIAFAACGPKDPTITPDDPGTTAAEDGTTEATVADESDLDYVLNKGVIVVGITNFAPMDFKEQGSDEWVGFDADMAKAFAAELGVQVEFVEIAWDNKVLELDAKSIDCVWNGMTLTDEVLAKMSCSNAYCNNAQVVVVAADKAENYKTVEDCMELSFAVEAGSAGEKMATENGFKATAVIDQASALMEVTAGTADAAIIDSLMADAMIGEGTAYESLTYTVPLNSEQYGVGFRLGSDLTEKLDDFFAKAYAEGKMQELAEKYNVGAALIAQ